MSSSTDSDPPIADPTAAEDAARRAGVTVREVASATESGAAADLLERIWSRNGALGAQTIHALRHSGNCVVAAFDGPRLVGVAIGFLGQDGERGLRLHSHIMGVAPEVQERSIGYALKLGQRDWALAHGIQRIDWTIDPLVRRNVYFNLTKLGARIEGYGADFYGRTRDEVNGGDATDRLLLEWDLRTPTAAERRVRPADGSVLRAEGASVLLDADPSGGPWIPPGSDVAASPRLIFVPEDIVALRRADAGLGQRWRLALREALSGELEAGRRVVGATRDGYYVIEGS